MLKVDRTKVLEEVAKKSARIASKTIEKPEEDEYDRVAVVDEDEEELLEFWDECRNDVVHTFTARFVVDGMNDEVPDLPPMPPCPPRPCPPPPPPQPEPEPEPEPTDETPTEEPTPEPEPTDEPSEEPTPEPEPEPDIYKLVLQVWPEFNRALVPMVERSLYAYYVNSIMAKWLMQVHHQDAELFATSAEVHLAEAKDKLIHKAFTRRSFFPY
jgi:hypothetical protein